MKKYVIVAIIILQIVSVFYGYLNLKMGLRTCIQQNIIAGFTYSQAKEHCTKSE